MPGTEGLCVPITGFQIVLSFYKWVLIQRQTRLPRAAGEGDIRGGPGPNPLRGVSVGTIGPNCNTEPKPDICNPIWKLSYFSHESARLSNVLFTFRDSKQAKKHGCSLVTKASTEKDVALAVILSHKGIKKERSPPLSTHSGSLLNHLDLFPRINKLHN